MSLLLAPRISNCTYEMICCGWSVGWLGLGYDQACFVFFKAIIDCAIYCFVSSDIFMAFDFLFIIDSRLT